MAQYFKAQIVNLENNAIFSEAIHYAKDWAAVKQIPRNCVIDGEISCSMQLTRGKEQSYAYFAHKTAEKGKVFYIKLEPQEFVNLNSMKYELRITHFIPNVAKLATPKGYFTKMNAEDIAESELTEENAEEKVKAIEAEVAQLAESLETAAAIAETAAVQTPEPAPTRQKGKRQTA